MTATEDSIDKICMAFAEVIDAKSPFTYRHSNGVADAAVEIGQWFGMNPKSLKQLRRAALLHDIGKLSVSNSILEKPGKLTNEEWTVRQGPPLLHARDSQKNSRVRAAQPGCRRSSRKTGRIRLLARLGGGAAFPLCANSGGGGHFRCAPCQAALPGRDPPGKSF